MTEAQYHYAIATMCKVTPERLRLAILWKRIREVEPPKPWWCSSGYYQMFPIRVPGLRWFREPPMQQIPRRRHA